MLAILFVVLLAYSGLSAATCETDANCKGDYNATINECAGACPATCAKPDNSDPCIAVCVVNGCVCNPGYILSEDGGQCISPEDCPACKGDYNAKFSECAGACPATCAKPNGSEFCTEVCVVGCVCKPGYILSKEGGKCIRPEDCPSDCR